MGAEPAQSRLIADNTVVDVDVHLQANALLADVADYMDREPYTSQIRHNPGRPPWPLDGFYRSFGKTEPESTATAADIQERLCVEFGVDYPVLNSFAFPTRMDQVDFAHHLSRAYNDVLLDKFLDEYDHFRGLATVAPQAPDRAAEELDRLGDEKQIVGVYFPTTGLHRLVGDPDFDMVYRAAEDNDLPVAFHAGAGASVRDFSTQQFRTFLEAHVLTHLWCQTGALTSLILHGVPEKFPDLKLVMLEAGVGWLPYLTYRLNKEVSMRRTDAPLLTKSPEEYIRESVYIATQPIGEPEDPEHLQQLLRMVGADSVLFATDFPHWDFDHPNAVERHFRSAFTEEEREKMLWRNANEIFDLGI